MVLPYRYPRRAGFLHLLHYVHHGGARTGTRDLQGAVTGNNTKEARGRQRTTAFLQGELAIAAAWGQEHVQQGPGLRRASKEATRRLDGEACTAGLCALCPDADLKSVRV